MFKKEHLTKSLLWSKSMPNEKPYVIDGRHFESNKIFVYGTLKRGGQLHSTIGSKVIGWKEGILRAADLYNAGWYPIAKYTPRIEREVYGELLVFRPQDMDGILDALDRIEAVEQGLFYRTIRFIKDRFDPNLEHKAYVYLGTSQQVNGLERIESGVWDNNQ